MYASSRATKCQLTGTKVMPLVEHANATSNHSLQLPATTEIVSPGRMPAVRKLSIS